MNAKILLIALSAAAFSSCTTAYKSGQTPDDVYYSPVKVVDESRNDDRRDEARQQESTAEDKRIRMGIRDRRWRDFDNDYDYSYNNSPYSYCTCTCNSYGYYYNPYYYSRPVYYPTVAAKTTVNTTPRMINLNSYKNYSNAVTSNSTKTGTGGTTWVAPQRQYNNSNNGGSKVGNVLRQVFTPGASNNSNSNNNNNSSNNNNTRTYTPPPSNSNSGSSGSSSSGSSSGSVARPGKGG